VRRLAALFLIFICALAIDAFAQDSVNDINAFLGDLEKKMAQVETIETDFTQEKNLALFNQPIILKGKIYIKKPEFFSWHVQSPVRYTMLIKDDIIKQWDEESGQVQQFSLSRNPGFTMAIAQMKVWFSGAYVSLLKDYAAKIISEDPVILEFSPIQSNPAFSLIKGVKVSFEKDQRYLREIRIEEKDGDSTILTFSSVKLNMPINPSAWELKRDVQ
jgi:outer membrane lipoprotein-sorting protein